MSNANAKEALNPTSSLPEEGYVVRRSRGIRVRLSREYYPQINPSIKVVRILSTSFRSSVNLCYGRLESLHLHDNAMVLNRHKLASEIGFGN